MGIPNFSGHRLKEGIPNVKCNLLRWEVEYCNKTSWKYFNINLLQNASKTKFAPKTHARMLFARFLPYEKSSTEIESAEGASDEFFYSSYTKHSNNPQFWAETCDFTPNVLKRSPKFRAEQTQTARFHSSFFWCIASAAGVREEIWLSYNNYSLYK